MHRLLKILFGFVFAVRCMLPVGFMLAASPVQGAGIEIIICTGHGLQSMTVADSDSSVPEKSPVSAKDTCPYTPVGATAPASEALPSLARTVEYVAVAYRIIADHYSATPLPSARSARGPPTA
ncbi:hypothetical protein DLM45_02210 [Hyphomicrobium methylovorum]|uniref:DUF2946 family protein n=1 Tax=Hyphomicrobium methylovorum TaxID=84 RepID=UPI0015E6A6F0|nr:DUF2946 family protein [Hyphomicrobium methylovorum]MBA2125040.1 hypothetical protein [Hyphomicrobium methylovorum]